MEQDRAGQRLGDYRLIRTLGSGGYATVYLGEHITLKSQAAIKVLILRILMLSDKERDRFLREANTIKRLSHHHIIRILACGIDVRDNGSIPYIVMHYAPGGNMRNMYAPGKPLPLEDVQSYINQAADGLQHAHDHAVVHCDIKPENMLVGELNQILLSDFGIADISHTADISELEQESPLYSSMIQGTIGYMAPERFQNIIRRASDQYSLGIVAYEWLTGELPFNGNRERIMYQHVTATPPSIRDRRPEVSLEIENVVMKALAKAPEQRHASVKEFARALDRAIQAILPVQVAPAPATSLISSAQTQAMPDSAHNQSPQDQPAQQGASPAASPASPAQDSRKAPPAPDAADSAAPPQQPASQPPAQDQAAAAHAANPGPAQPSPEPPPVPPLPVQPIVLQANNAGSIPGQGQQGSAAASQQPLPSRSQWYQNNAGAGNVFFNDPSLSTTFNMQPDPPPLRGGALSDFTDLFTDLAAALQHFFELDPEFDRLAEFRRFRSFGMFLNIISVFAMGLIYRSWAVGLFCVLAPVAFWLCIRLVKPMLAGTVGVFLAAYWGWVAWSVTSVLLRIPLFATLPGPDFMAVIVFVISAVLHFRYVLRRNG
jgi:serine/threonine protein kinase